ncbi:MAG: hypothetical protein H8E42_03780 [Nitrospinae bacterium]|nr:hypothetical protein [Nitrospinota bacterium]MBL7020724.1 hypothetical protein [Nitrospinaceae bacterium]
MRGISKITSYLLSAVFLLVVASEKSWGQVTDDVLKEAKTLAKLEDDYFKKRLNNDLKGTYQYQHPVYKEKISLEEFLYFEGRLISEYREGGQAHISGGMLPPMDYIKKNPSKRDALGFPRPSRYKWFVNPFITVKSYSLERISISEDGKYAMTEIMLEGTERLNPVLVRGNISFDMNRPHIDYWEKVDGKWVITVLVDNSSISGSRKTLYFIPNNNDAWQKMEYVQIDSASLLAEPDPERHALNGKN